MLRTMFLLLGLAGFLFSDVLDDVKAVIKSMNEMAVKKAGKIKKQNNKNVYDELSVMSFTNDYYWYLPEIWSYTKEEYTNVGVITYSSSMASMQTRDYSGEQEPSWPIKSVDAFYAISEQSYTNLTHKKNYGASFAGVPATYYTATYYEPSLLGYYTVEIWHFMRNKHGYSVMILSSKDDYALNKLLYNLYVSGWHFFEVTASKPLAKIKNGINNFNNYPNPFKPNTKIEYSLENDGHVDLTVYNIDGKQIINLISNIKGAGSYSVDWNGKDSFGNAVSSGNYVVKMNADNKTKTIKINFLK